MDCIKCGSKAIKDTTYRPPKGMDNHMEKHICTNTICQAAYYTIAPAAGHYQKPLASF